MRNYQLNIRINQEEKQRLRVCAAIEGYTQADIVRIALLEYLAKRRGLKDRIIKALTNE